MMSSTRQENDRATRAKAIDEYAAKHGDCIIDKPQKAWIGGKFVDCSLYCLPLKLVRLRITNSRFKADLGALYRKSTKGGKVNELDYESTEDQEIIRKILRGEDPENSNRRKSYSELMENIIANASNGTNGQLEPGQITWDGICTEANRRATILHDLTNDPPTNCTSSQFEKIMVVRLPDTIDLSDIMANETRAQLSEDSREKYERINYALMIDEYYTYLTETKNLIPDVAMEEIAHPTYGIDVKDIKKLLNLKKTADEFLKIMGRPKQYDYLLSGSKDEAGIIQILEDIPSKISDLKTTVKNQKQRRNLTKSLYVFAALAKLKPKFYSPITGKELPSEFTHRGFTPFLKDGFKSESARNKLLESGNIENIDFQKMDSSEYLVDSAQKVTGDITRAKDITTSLDRITEPTRLLETASINTTAVLRALNSRHKNKVQKDIHDNGLRHIKQIQSDIAQIKKKMDKFGHSQ